MRVMHRIYMMLIIVIFLLTGCWDLEESDRMDYVHGVGVDYQEGQVVIHLQIANLGSLGTPEVVPVGESPITIASSSGNNISSAIHDIYQSAQRKLYFGHDTFMIISEEALKNNKLQESIDLMNRFPETRYRVNIFTTKSDVKELLKVTTPIQGTPILTRLTDLQNTYEQSSLIEHVSMRELIIELTEPGYDGIIPAVALDESTWEAEEKPLKMIKTIGVALMKPDMFNGFILYDDSNGLRWTEESKRNNLTIYQDEKAVSEVIVLNPKQKYTVKLNNDQVTFQLSVKVRGIINEVIEDVDQEFIIQTAEQEINKEIMTTYVQGLKLDSDIYRLSEILYRRHLNVWKKIEENGTIPLDENSLEVKVTLDLIDSSIDKTKPTIE